LSQRAFRGELGVKEEVVKLICAEYKILEVEWQGKNH
jgi:hypothetical protein